MNELFQSIIENQFLQAAAILLGVVAPILGLVTWIIRSLIKKNKIVNVEKSQEDFVTINKKFGGHNRTIISGIAHSVNLNYLNDGDYFDIRELPLLIKKDWLPETPILLEKVSSTSTTDKKPTLNPVKLPLPYKDSGNRFPVYTKAVQELLKPKMFEDNRQYRLLEIKNKNDSFEFIISEKPYSYFYKINYGKGAQHELIANLLEINKIDLYDDIFSFKKTPKIKSLPFRKQILDGLKSTGKFDHTVTLGGISTLTLIFNGSSFRFLLHERGSGQGYAANIRHVIPAGEYQPLSKGDNFSKDLDFWNNIMREYAEELGNMSEFKGEDGKIFDYNKTIPFNLYLEAVEEGYIRNFFLGTGLDPLSLQAEIITVSIFHESTFNSLFGPKPFTKNDEGFIITDAAQWGIPFNEKEINQRLEEGLLAAGHSVLKLALKHVDYFKEDLSS